MDDLYYYYLFFSLVLFFVSIMFLHLMISSNMYLGEAHFEVARLTTKCGQLPTHKQL